MLIFVMCMQFVIIYEITLGSCCLSCNFTFHLNIMCLFPLWQWEVIGESVWKIQNIISDFELTPRSQHIFQFWKLVKGFFSSFFLSMFSYVSISEITGSQAEISLCCKSWLCYLENGAFEMIKTLLDLIFWLREGNWVFEVKFEWMFFLWTQNFLTFSSLNVQL